MLTNLALAAAFFFAFADEKGERLLALSGDAANVKSITKAICEPNKVLAVTAKGAQPKGAKDSGRDVARNFDQRAGFVFTVSGGKAAPDESCLLVDDAYLASRKPVAFTAEKRPEKCTPALEKAVAAAKTDWKSEACSPFGTLAGGAELALVRFKAKKKKALASLVLMTGKTVAFRDMPADVDAGSMWRVDDQGTIGAGAFSVPVALQAEGGAFDLVFDWGAFEGSNLQLLRNKGGVLETVLEDARYWSPE